ncbi:HEAT repeat domain-containing protein [Natronorubrum sp. JWXQ-INN-674]|uniref:HEAT repeat domain-containing protein n=1 Tax=Natronorubrum halalkaliphilum TaxID=2691917 RepID=A0A6B0VRZ4_9EURY|nr:HEAT repeat domain-containing protein [Natronorubrum halalkaliphilum]MXV64308.1 HEAT repeat domain-containing protein [Natronorubrum halalkaliphilum]
MDGDGNGDQAIKRRRGNGAAFDLPSVLAQLDRQEPTAQRAAVETIRDTLDDHPGACLPTVPKLRALLEQEVEFHGSIAYCLAELAMESPEDVAPSIDEIVSFADDRAPQPATAELLRCLAAIAAERPDTVAEHTATIAGVIDRRSDYDRWGLRIFQRVSRERPAAIEPAVPVLTDALAANPGTNGVSVLSTLGRLARAETSLPSLEFVDRAVDLVEHDDASLRNNALGCLADVARHAPSAVEPARPELAAALEHADPDTRANAAVAIARVAAGTGAEFDAADGPLLALLTDDHDRVRANACVAVAHGELEAATDRLAALANRDPDPDVRERAEWALERLS